jgi:hypothetical protein
VGDGQLFVATIYWEMLVIFDFGAVEFCTSHLCCGGVLSIGTSFSSPGCPFYDPEKVTPRFK